MIEIRMIEMKDVETVSEIYRRLGERPDTYLFGSTRHYRYPHQVEGTIRFGLDFTDWFLAVKGEEIIGFGKIFEEGGLYTPHTGVLSDLFVCEEYRGQGIGEALVRKLLDSARLKNKIEIVRLEVNGDNEAALGLYRKVGFEVCGRLPDYLKVGEGRYCDRVTMYLDLR